VPLSILPSSIINQESNHHTDYYHTLVLGETVV
jgi:hypothetical protein